MATATKSANNNGTKNQDGKINTGISMKNREKVADSLNQLLADEMLLYIKTLKFHWNIEGRDFHALHLFLEEQYTQLQSIIDSVAERVRKIGFYANGSMKQFLKDASLDEHEKTGRITEDLIAELAKDHDALIRNTREMIDTFEEECDDAGSSDFITGVMKQHEKMAWMLRASVR